MSKKYIKLIALISTLMLVLLSCVSVNAESQVIYDSNANEFVFSPGSDHSPTDLFENFKNVMPGDSLTQSITVKNDEDNEVKVNIYLRALGAKEGSEELLSKLNLKVAKSSDNRMAYMFDAAANETDGLSEWVLLGTLYSGGEVNLEVTLDVPIELGNEFQDAAGYLEWEFKVEELPIDPDDPEPPKTGEEIKGYLLAAFVVLALGTMVMIHRSKKRSAEF